MQVVTVTEEEAAGIDAMLSVMIATPEYRNAFAPLSPGCIVSAQYMVCMLRRAGFAVDGIRVADRMGLAIRFGGTHEIKQHGASISGLPFKAFEWAFPNSFDTLGVCATPDEIAAWVSKHTAH